MSSSIQVNILFWEVGIMDTRCDHWLIDLGGCARTQASAARQHWPCGTCLQSSLIFTTMPIQITSTTPVWSFHHSSLAFHYPTDGQASSVPLYVMGSLITLALHIKPLLNTPSLCYGMDVGWSVEIDGLVACGCGRAEDVDRVGVSSRLLALS